MSKKSLRCVTEQKNGLCVQFNIVTKEEIRCCDDSLNVQRMLAKKKEKEND